ncbi:uncharacterized protein G2W53_028590 [Senna tora]|uniref:Uncharacterized protein n=1 Tax=Senna tora TaxID=362788 RepID=A0A834T5N7_9FABA|nr:uncharacterized protein G2W53_028590 [Senna tora]
MGIGEAVELTRKACVVWGMPYLPLKLLLSS